jgi:hypothetical protein
MVTPRHLPPVQLTSTPTAPPDMSAYMAASGVRAWATCDGEGGGRGGGGGRGEEGERPEREAWALLILDRRTLGIKGALDGLPRGMVTHHTSGLRPALRPQGPADGVTVPRHLSHPLNLWGWSPSRNSGVSRRGKKLCSDHRQHHLRHRLQPQQPTNFLATAKELSSDHFQQHLRHRRQTRKSPPPRQNILRRTSRFWNRIGPLPQQQ